MCDGEGGVFGSGVDVVVDVVRQFDSLDEKFVLFLVDTRAVILFEEVLVENA